MTTARETIEERKQRLGITGEPPKGWENVRDEKMPLFLEWHRKRAAGWLGPDAFLAHIGVPNSISILLLFSKINLKRDSELNLSSLYPPLSFEELKAMPFFSKLAGLALKDCKGFAMRCMADEETRAMFLAELMSE